MNAKINTHIPLNKPEDLVDLTSTKNESHSRFSSWLGINHLVDFTTALKRKEYAESANELLKAAIKWTTIGIICMGAYKWTFRKPVFIDQVHQLAIEELTQANYPLTEISENAKSFIDHNFAELNSFKRWPQSGKEYVAKSLESNFPAGVYSTSYFVEKGIENSDSSLINEVIKECSSASRDTQSCLTAEKIMVIPTNIESFSRKMESSCKKSTNTFCQYARSAIFAYALENKDWEYIIKNCVKLNAYAQCPAALKLLNQKLEDSSEESWATAKKIDQVCKAKNLDVCKKAQVKAIAEAAKYESWPNIIDTLKSKCKVDATGCSELLDESAAKFIKKIDEDPTVKMDSSDVRWELEFNHHRQRNIFEIQNDLSEISVALELAKACATLKTANSQQNANKILEFLENYLKTLSTDHWNSWRIDRLKELLKEQMDPIKQKIKNT